MLAKGEILVIDAGSSSVKIAGFSDDRSPQQLWSGAVERMGLSNGRFHIRLVQGERIVIANLGHGASMAAIHEGRSDETTMSFSALGRLPMGTRCGDLDPGIVLHLLSKKELAAKRVEHILYEESGLLGISGISGNMQDLLAQQKEARAAEAIAFSCYQARKHLGSLPAVLGGLDHLVFTGGIGANAPAVRAKIWDGLEYLGVRLDDDHNGHGGRGISEATARYEPRPWRPTKSS